MDTNRKTAYFALIDIEEKKAFSNLALNLHITECKPDSPAFVRELVYGVLENKMYLDYKIQYFIKTPVKKLKNSDKTILRMGIYQLDYMESVPSYAAVNESVNLAKRFCRGRESFINGVLRNYIRKQNEIELPDPQEDLVKYLSIKYSYAPWIVMLWLDIYEPQFVEELLNAGNQTPDLVILPNRLKTTKEDIKRRLTAKGYEVKDGFLIKDALHVKGHDLIGGKLFCNGMFSVLDESSMMAVKMLDPQPGELIMDVCAAPGGKSIYIAELMDNRGRIIAQDIYEKRLKLVENEMRRTGVSIIKTRIWDAVKYDSAMEGLADRVLVDAPCSGLGVVRRKPEIKYKEYDEEIKKLPVKQLDILSSSSKYVKKDGVLVYSTCTINPDENQKVVMEFLKNNDGFIKEESIQLIPNINNTDGFYICRMRRS